VSRVWLVIGMVLSLVVPVGFIAYSYANPVDTQQQASTVSTNSSSGQDSSDSFATTLAVETVKGQLDELRSLNEAHNWGTSRSSKVRRIAAKLREAAPSLDSRPEIRRVALEGAAFALALDQFRKHPSSSRYYHRYDAARKALNKAIDAAQ
jgi:hypothetical protein